LQRKLERELRADVAAGIDPYAAADRVLGAFNVGGVETEEEFTAARRRASVKGLT